MDARQKTGLIEIQRDVRRLIELLETLISPDMRHEQKATSVPLKGTPRTSYLMKEIPKITGRGLSTAYRDAKAGKLRVRKSGRSTIIMHDDLMAWLGSYKETE